MQDAVGGVGSGVVDARVGQAGARIDLDDVTKRHQIGEVDVTALDGGLGARAPDRVQRHPHHRRGTATRTRHHACVRTPVLGVVVKESIIVGVIATLVGSIGGVVFLRWMLASLAITTLPDVGINVYLSRPRSSSLRASASRPSP